MTFVWIDDTNSELRRPDNISWEEWQAAISKFMQQHDTRPRTEAADATRTQEQVDYEGDQETTGIHTDNNNKRETTTHKTHKGNKRE